MTPEGRAARVVAAIAAAVVAVAFFALSVDRHVYAPGSAYLHHNPQLLGISDASPQSDRREMGAFRTLRKLYSVVAFAAVGICLAPALPRRRRLVLAIAGVAVFSAGIEVAQYVRGSHESHLSQAFDVGCGGLGGALGALVWNGSALLRRRFDRRRFGRAR